MKIKFFAAVFFALVVFHCALPIRAATTTIDGASRSSYGANIGWADWRGNTNNGAVIGEYVCAGYIWSANVGWICLGDGAPANGVQYQNGAVYDYGVNRDGSGNLRGYAYGANIGWVAFETNGAPRVDLSTGRLSGSIYSANCGWISLSNLFAFVQTSPITVGDTDHDGLPDSWELAYAPNLTRFTGTNDFDGDRISDLQEYVADTNPTNRNSLLAITGLGVLKDSGAEFDAVTWSSRPTRRYVVHAGTNVNESFPDVTDILLPDAGTNTTRTLMFELPGPHRFFRVQALLPVP